MLERLEAYLSAMCYCQGFIAGLLFSWFAIWLFLKAVRLFKE